MKKFDVTCYKVVAVKFHSVEADDPIGAIRIAEAADFHNLLRNPDVKLTESPEYMGYTDDTVAYVVDPIGENGQPDYEQTLDVEDGFHMHRYVADNVKIADVLWCAEDLQLVTVEEWAKQSNTRAAFAVAEQMGGVR